MTDNVDMSAFGPPFDSSASSNPNDLAAKKSRDTADRVMMRFGEKIEEALYEAARLYEPLNYSAVAADALSSHGLRELIAANEHAYQALMGKYDRQDALTEQRKLREPAALLGEGE